METLTALALLVCPVGMGLMMWFMARNGRHHAADPRRMSLADLEAEHRRLGAQLDQHASPAAEPKEHGRPSAELARAERRQEAAS